MSLDLPNPNQKELEGSDEQPSEQNLKKKNTNASNIPVVGNKLTQPDIQRGQKPSGQKANIPFKGKQEVPKTSSLEQKTEPSQQPGREITVPSPQSKVYNSGHSRDSYVAKEGFYLEASEIVAVLVCVAKMRKAEAIPYPGGGKSYGHYSLQTVIHVDRNLKNKKYLEFKINVLIDSPSDVVKGILFVTEENQSEYYNIGDAVDSLARTLADN